MAVRVGSFYVEPDMQYWDNYLWISRISDSELQIGLTDFAQKTLKDIISIDAPSPGQRLHKSSNLLKVETISRDYLAKSPVSCIVLNVNEEAINSPDIVNEQPFTTWLVHVECLDLKDLDQLISGDDMMDILLQEAGPNDSEEFESEDFDYENELSIETGDDDYYNDDMQVSYDADDEYGFTPDDDYEW